MNMNSAELVYFSPTGTTKTIVAGIAEGLGARPSLRDMTAQSGCREGHSAGEIVVIGVPVHAGRVPELAAARLRAEVRGEGRPSVLAVVYGNRAFEDALLELRDLALELGFVPVAGAAFIGEHSFSTPQWPVAQGRPDAADLDKARAFGRLVRELLDGVPKPADLRPLEVPGNFPYRQGVQPSSICPETDAQSCILCGECARSCPSGAITLAEDSVLTEAALCLRCCACTRTCPTGARVMRHEKILEFGRMLSTQYATRREPEFFLGNADCAPQSA
ncbi:4Fe-4S binding protein [Desulfomicrobium salsuginis]